MGCLYVCLGLVRTANAVDKAVLVKEITVVVEQLGNADPIHVEAAQIILTQLSPSRFPVLQEVVAKGTFSPVVTERAKKFIESQLPFQEALRSASSWRISWPVGGTGRWRLAAYEKAGQKDPKWDDDVRAAITAFTEVKGGLDAPVYTLADKAIKSGCQDAYVSYVLGRATGVQERAGCCGIRVCPGREVGDRYGLSSRDQDAVLRGGHQDDRSADSGNRRGEA